MLEGQPSRTSMICAACRASHLADDAEPFIFVDPYAFGLMGAEATDLLRGLPSDHPLLADTRVRATARSRYAEDQLASACEDGVDQYVNLGAGLDSFVYRNDLASSVHTFEVDHPATQQWKRERVEAAGLEPKGQLTYVAVDFTHGEDVADALSAAGLDMNRPAFVSWLGVTFYLTIPAIATTVSSVARLASGSHLVLEYNLPDALRDEAGKLLASYAEPAAIAEGEPWLTSLAPDDMTTLLEQNGMKECVQVPQSEWIEPALWQRTDSLRASSFAMIAHART